MAIPEAKIGEWERAKEYLKNACDESPRRTPIEMPLVDGVYCAGNRRYLIVVAADEKGGRSRRCGHLTNGTSAILYVSRMILRPAL